MQETTTEILLTLNPPPFHAALPYQIKNSKFRDKATPGQGVDLHGVLEVGDQELMVREKGGAQMRFPRIQNGKRNERAGHLKKQEKGEAVVVRGKTWERVRKIFLGSSKIKVLGVH